MTGWRLGYLIAPREFVRPAEKIQQNFFLAANAFVQQAGVVALTESQPDVVRMRALYDERRQFLVPALRDIGLTIDSEPAAPSTCSRTPVLGRGLAAPLLEAIGRGGCRVRARDRLRPGRGGVLALQLCDIDGAAGRGDQAAHFVGGRTRLRVVPL
jgi:histidinol-phosphate/aromatic aminotransferase/cobyric acid decarboxylase-like protein